MPAPNLTEPAEVSENSALGIGGWMKDLPSLDGEPVVASPTPPAAPPAKEKEKEEPEPAAAAPAAPAPATEPPPPPAPAKPAPAKAEPKPEEEEEKWPRSGQDWDRFKARRREKEQKLQEEIKARDAKLSDIEAKYRKAQEEAGAALAKSSTPSPELQAEVERLKKENEEYSQRLAVTEVTAHPKFQAYFSGKVNEQVSMAKEIVGEERAAQVEKILSLPDSEYKRLQMEELSNELSPLQQGQLSNVIVNLRMIDREKAAEIARSQENRTKMVATQKEQMEKQVAENKRIFSDVVKQVQDPKNGLAVYQFRDGDNAWNEAVKSRIAVAEKVLFGATDIKKEDIVRHTLNAAAFPVLLDAYRKDIDAKDAEIAKLEAQVKSLSAAQPTRGSVGTTETSSGETPQPVKINRGMSPMEAAANWMKNVIEPSETP